MEKRSEWSRKYYHSHRDIRLQQIKEARKERIKKIKERLGNKCAICGASSPLVTHHLNYTSNGRATLKDLEKGYIMLTCRRHHRAINYVNQLKRDGFLEKILQSLNQKEYPG